MSYRVREIHWGVPMEHPLEYSTDVLYTITFYYYWIFHWSTVTMDVPLGWLPASGEKGRSLFLTIRTGILGRNSTMLLP
jgi:hypothetical protein